MSFESMTWHDNPNNPLIEPIRPDWMVADPSVLPPDIAPDGRWHLFANAILQGIQHFVSDDGINWTRVARKLFIGIRPYVFFENGTYYLFYEKPASLRRSVVALRTSHDLIRWSEPKTMISPQYKWEGRGLVTNGNPCVVKFGGGYRLYFSAGWVFLPDCLFLEPRYIGVAAAERIDGPYEKLAEPLIGPSESPFFRNMGAGSMKVIAPQSEGAPWYAFNNGIYRDSDGHSRSEIHLLKSSDGLDWRLVSDSPLIAPEPDGWKRALVYAMHVVQYQDEWRMYYNARSGWFVGKERIGMATGSNGV